MNDSANTISILVAQQNDILLQAYQSLEERDSQITIVYMARDGREAVEMSKAMRPRVVVLDVALPILDGIAATRLIKVAQPDTKVLVLTAHESDEMVFAALAAGADGYCLKSSRMRQLLQAIKALACGATWLDRAVAERVLREASKGYAQSTQVTAFGLSPRQLEVLRMLVAGMTNAQIAAALCVTVDIVKAQLRIIMEKLMVSDRTQAAVQAFRAGIGQRRSP